MDWELIMKVNQLLLSFMFLLGFSHNALEASQAVKAIKGIGKAAGFVGRIMRGTERREERRIFMAVNAGAEFLKLLDGLLKQASPVENGENMSAVQILAAGLTADSAQINQILKYYAREKLDRLQDWFIDKQISDMQNATDDNGEKLYTEEAIGEHREKIKKATDPFVRLLKGTSKPYERVAIWLVLKTVSLINRIRKFAGGTPLDTSSNIAQEAASFLVEQVSSAAFIAANDVITYVGQTAHNVIDGVTTALTEAPGNIQRIAIDALTNPVVVATVETVNHGIEVASHHLSNLVTVFQGGANYVTDLVGGGLVHGAALFLNFMNWANRAENKFITTQEIPDTLLALLMDTKNLQESLKGLMPESEEYVQMLQDIAVGIQVTLQDKKVTQKTLDLLFSNIDKTIEETTLRKIDLTDFSKLPDPLKAKIVDAWKNAKSQDLVEGLVNLQAKDIDKELLEVIGKNAEWKELKAEELIQIPETLYDFLSLSVLIEVKKALQATTPPDFDTINKLTTLSLAEEKAFKQATLEELLNLPSETYREMPSEKYKEMPEEDLKKLQEQLLLKDAQLKPEEMLNDPYGPQLKIIEALMPKNKPMNDAQSIQQQAATAKTKQETSIAQKTIDTTSTTQTTPDKTASTAQSGTVTSPQTNSNTAQTTPEEEIWHDALTTEELQKRQNEEKTAQERQAQEEKVAKEKAKEEKAKEESIKTKPKLEPSGAHAHGAM
jgi:hypothetical protein